MNKLKVAVIGCGSISRHHLDGYTQNPHTELYAVCDINEVQLNKRGDEYNVSRRYTDVETMLRELPELDAVSVCTWNSAHAPCTIAALNAGKHVLCEKPMATNAQDAQKMLEAAEKNGKLLMIGFVRRFGNDCKVLQDFIDQGRFGELYYSKATYLRRKGSPGGWFGDKERSGGGPLIDLGVHVIDLTRYLMGNPKPVSVYGAAFHKLGDLRQFKHRKVYRAASAKDDDPFNVEDAVTAMIRYDNGAITEVECSFSLNIKENKGEIELFGTRAGAKLAPELEIFTDVDGYLANVQLTMPTALDLSGIFEKEVDHFIDCVLNGTPCRNPAQDGVDIMRILDAIYESARTGHEVILG